MVPSTQAPPIEIVYDTGIPGGMTYLFSGGVDFSLPSGVSRAKILTIRFQWSRADRVLTVHIAAIDRAGARPEHLTELIPPITTSPTSAQPIWNSLDVSSSDIVVTGEFYVFIEKRGQGTDGLVFDNSAGVGRSFWETPWRICRVLRTQTT